MKMLKVSVLVIMSMCFLCTYARPEISSGYSGACQCGKNEYLANCASSCYVAPTCLNREPKESEVCDFRCNEKCVCCEGYIRDDKTEKCIPIDECPKSTDPWC